jgi:hypothetical protein
LPGRRAFDRRPETEEGVVLDSALPQVLASLLVAKPEQQRRTFLLSFLFLLNKIFDNNKSVPFHSMPGGSPYF